MKEFVVEHHIQREILRRLSIAKSLHFSELKPDGMESNIFMYHLNQLIKSRHVEKQDKSYQLALNGLRYADNIISSTQFSPARHPKPLAVVVLHNDKGQVLMTLRHTQPYIDTYMFLSGKQHFGEDPLPHAHRELREKAELENITLRRRGLADFRIHDRNGEVVTHMIGHVYSGTYNGPTPKSWTERYSFEWVKPNKMANLPHVLGTLELYDTLTKSGDKLFFMSRDFSLR